MVNKHIFLLLGLLLSIPSWADHLSVNSDTGNFIRTGFDVPERIFSKNTDKRQSTELTNSIGIKFIRVPSGEFQMGSADGDEDERPLHIERISKHYYFGKYEITQGQWKKVMGTEPWLKRDFVQVGGNYPAVYINWLEAREFIARLNEIENCACYRLPTEVEWEYAARAGSVSTYSHGSDAGRLGRYAWYSDNIQSRSAQRIGLKQPNPWGLYDIHGNVWEWVADWHKNDRGPRIRGGSWGSPKDSLRSANRSAADVGRRASHIGFRLVRIKE